MVMQLVQIAELQFYARIPCRLSALDDASILVLKHETNNNSSNGFVTYVAKHGIAPGCNKVISADPEQNDANIQQHFLSHNRYSFRVLKSSLVRGTIMGLYVLLPFLVHVRQGPAISIDLVFLITPG